MEEIVRQRALALASRGYQAGVNIDPGDPYFGKRLEMGELYYQTPRVPGHHFQQRYVEGRPRPPVMLPGSLDERIALELAIQDERFAREQALEGGPVEFNDLSPSQRAYDTVLAEVDRRARQGQPLRRQR